MNELLKVLFLFLFIFLTSCEENSNITSSDDTNSKLQIVGSILDKINNTPISGAHLYTNPPSEEATSYSKGNFTIKNLDIGNYTIYATHDNYETDSIKIEVNKNIQENIKITMYKKTTYVTPPPVGYLPYPQHKPSFTKSEYDQMMNNLWIINNFGLDQTFYLHDGFDIVLENGTKLYAIVSGNVRYVKDDWEYFNSIIIEDKDNPGYGWSYVHTDNFNFEVGDYVQQGEEICDINFMGLGHVHLRRVKLKENNSWNNYEYNYSIIPDQYFYYNDTEEPVLRSYFYYFPNNSDSLILNGSPNQISGEIDIVVAARERGEYARSNENFGDRLAITKFDYAIEAPDGTIHNFNSFDFSKIYLDLSDEIENYQKLFFKTYTIIEGEERSSGNAFVSYYNITNYKNTDSIEPINLSNSNLCWKTDAINLDGSPVYPNGTYKISVTAYDYLGHSTTKANEVTVAN